MTYPSKEQLGDLHPKEIDLIIQIRKRYRYGEITLQIRDGIPWKIVKERTFQNLGED